MDEFVFLYVWLVRFEVVNIKLKGFFLVEIKNVELRCFLVFVFKFFLDIVIELGYEDFNCGM